MKHLTLSDYHRKNQYRFIALAAFVSLALAGLSNSFAQEDQSITLTTNKGSYLPGDTVQVSGIVTGQSSALVPFKSKTPTEISSLLELCKQTKTETLQYS